MNGLMMLTFRNRVTAYNNKENKENFPVLLFFLPWDFIFRYLYWSGRMHSCIALLLNTRCNHPFIIKLAFGEVGGNHFNTNFIAHIKFASTAHTYQAIIAFYMA